MNKRWIVWAGVVFGCWPGLAPAQGVRYDLKAGGNYSTLYFQDVTRPDRRLGFSAAGVARLPLAANSLFSVQPELAYSAKGAQTTYQGQTNRSRFHYLELPVLVHLQAKGLFVEAGPQLSYLLGTRFETAGGTETGRAGYRRLLVGAVAGVGYQVPMGLSLTLRYANDLTRLSDQGPRHTLYQLQVGYLFAPH